MRVSLITVHAVRVTDAHWSELRGNRARHQRAWIISLCTRREAGVIEFAAVCGRRLHSSSR